MAHLLTKASADSYIWPCECSSYHYLTIDWDDADPTWRLLEISDTYHPTRWRDRIAAAWKMLRGQEHWPVSVLLDDANVADIMMVLSKHTRAASVD